jgi:chromosome segregation ATPase
MSDDEGPEPEVVDAAADGSIMEPDESGNAEGTPRSEDASDAHFLPPFANEYNKDISRQVKGKEERHRRIAKDVDDQNERVRVMDEHLANVKQELVHTQALCDAKMKEIESEDHLRMLADREGGRLVQELKKIEIEKAELQERLNAIQTAIFQGNERMDSFKQMMNWNQEELEQWALAAAQKEEDNLALLKYTRADEAKIKDLNLQLEKLTNSLAEQKQALEDEVTETQAKQIELDKTAEDFKKLHLDRQGLVQQWEDTIAAMARRDEEIADAGQKYGSEREEMNRVEKELQERRAFLEKEKKNNEQVDAKIVETERIVARAREDYRRQLEMVDELVQQVQLTQSELASATSELTQVSAQITNGEEQLQLDVDKLERFKTKLKDTADRIAKEQQDTDALEKTAAEKEEMRLAQEKLKVHVQAEIKALRDLIFKQSQELFKQRKDESNLLGEISGAETACKNLQFKINKLDEHSLKQQEHVYTAEFQIQLLERKVRRAEGAAYSESETTELNEKIVALQKEMDDKAAQGALLDKQTKKLEDDLRAGRRVTADQLGQESKLTDAVNELGLENDTIARNIISFRKRKEDITVQHDVMKLEVRRLRDVLNSRADEVFGLENRKAQLQLSMEEREREIAVHRETLRGELKLAEEDRSKVSKELKERMLKIETLKKKYDVICGRMAAGDAEDGEHTQAFYVIKAAQQREELQREGDSLDSKIRQAEKEVRTLEKAMGKIYESNENLKGSYAKVDTASKAFLDMQKLETKFESAMEKRKVMRREKESLEADLSSMQQKLASLKLEKGALGQSVTELEKSIERQGREISEQLPRLEQATAKATGARRNLRQQLAAGAEEVTLAEREVACAELRESNRHALQCVVDLVKDYDEPELEGTIAELMQESSLRPPSRAEEGRRPDSAASQVSVQSIEFQGA